MARKPSALQAPEGWKRVKGWGGWHWKGQGAVPMSVHRTSSGTVIAMVSGRVAWAFGSDDTDALKICRRAMAEAERVASRPVTESSPRPRRR